MQAVVFAVHLIVSLALVGVILLQRSEGGALGIGGGANAMVSGRGAASLLTRATGVLAILFFITSLSLAALAGIKKKHDILDLNVPVSSAPASSVPLSVPVAPAAIAPAAPAIPAPTPEKSSALEVAPKVNSAAAAETKPAAKPVVKPVVTAPAKPAIPEPTAESPVPFIPEGPTNSGGNDAAGGGGGAGPQPR